MLTKVTITDRNDTPLFYAKGVFKDGESFEFKPGVNIIVGENGCGKSTLMKLIATYGLCIDGMVSAIPDDVLRMQNMFDWHSNVVHKGCVVNADYNGIFFKYTPAIEFRDNDDALGSMDAFKLVMSKNNSSMGEGMLDAIGALFNKMNTEKNVQFPIDAIVREIKTSNEMWGKSFSSLLDYYKENAVNVTIDEFEYTVLMDEPDRNLDIKHIKELYNILTYHRPMTQLVVVLHNPVLISKLSKTDVNFIEMTPGYLKRVNEFVRWAR